ncbi:MAG: transposase [Methylococcales bacterium]|nr:transposase [Methylococcales bacterium]
MATELFSAVLQKFIDKSPVTVMVQGLLEQLLNAEKLNQWFDNNSGVQYTRNLLFSSVIAIMLDVVCQTRASVKAAHQKSDHIGVSLASLYNKINGLETSTSAALVRYIGAESIALIKEMNVEYPDWVEGYNTRLLDGNCIEATEHRIKALRNTKSGALPGKSLVVFDPKTEVAIDIFLCEDGHAQERSLLDDVLKTIKENDLWVADRNFCTQAFLFGIQFKKAAFVIREHASMPTEELNEETFIGNCETGAIYEQQVRLKSPENETYLARRIIVKLNKKTRNDDNEIRILTTLSSKKSDALKIAEIYEKRWGIETAFQRLEGHFHSEINSLGYPKAALFGFCVALVAFNLYAVVMAAIRAANPEIIIKDQVSEYYIASEITAVYEGMVIAVDNNDWEFFRRVNRAQMAVILIYLAEQVNLKKFKKNKRGEKKPKPKIKCDKNEPHVSTLKMILKSNKSP